MKFLEASRIKTVLRAALLVLGAVFVAAGVTGGEAQTVLRKAIYICLECIGIG